MWFQLRSSQIGAAGLSSAVVPAGPCGVCEDRSTAGALSGVRVGGGVPGRWRECAGVGAFPPSFRAGGAGRAGALAPARPVPFQPVLAGEIVTVTVSSAIPIGLEACTVKV